MINAVLDETSYEKGIKVSDEEMEATEVGEIKEGGDPADLEDFAKMDAEVNFDDIEDAPEEELKAMEEDPEDLDDINIEDK